MSDNRVYGLSRGNDARAVYPPKLSAQVGVGGNSSTGSERAGVGFWIPICMGMTWFVIA